MIRDVIRRYNEGLDDTTAATAHAELAAGLAADDLRFGDRPLCDVLRPQLLSEAEYAFLQHTCGVLLAALAKAYDAIVLDPELQELVAPTPLEQAAMAIEPGFAAPTPFSRLDAFLSRDHGTFRFVEYNAETPAGVGYEDVLGRLFQRLEPVQKLAAAYPLRAVEGAGTILSTLLALHAEAGLPGRPGIAIIDWDGVPTRPEHHILAHHFRRAGVAAVVGAPDELRFAGGHLLLRDEPVTIIYKRVLAGELLAATGLDHPLLSALRAGAAVMANPFRCKLLHKKAIFAVLSDERYSHLYSAGELAVIRAHVPWTRRLEARHTTYGNRRVDLLPWAAENREQLVLKANDDYGGRGVILGWEVGDGAWSRALANGLQSPTVLQERVQVAREPFPVWDGHRLRIEERFVDLDPFCYGGKVVHGLLTRLSTSSLLNITAGGATLAPTFILDV